MLHPLVAKLAMSPRAPEIKVSYHATAVRCESQRLAADSLRCHPVNNLFGILPY